MAYADTKVTMRRWSRGALVFLCVTRPRRIAVRRVKGRRGTQGGVVDGALRSPPTTPRRVTAMAALTRRSRSGDHDGCADTKVTMRRCSRGALVFLCVTRPRRIAVRRVKGRRGTQGGVVDGALRSPPTTPRRV